MDASRREQYVREFFAAKMDKLAAMPPCLESLFLSTLSSEGVALTYVPANAARPVKGVTYAALPALVDEVAANVQAKIGVGNGHDRAVIKLANYKC